MSPRSSPDSSIQDLRQRIADCAREKFLDRGFARTSIDDLARELSISKKTFYTAFVSKEALVEHVMVSIMNDVNGCVEEILRARKDFIAKLSELMEFLGTMSLRVTRAFGQDLQRLMPAQWRKVEDFRHQRIMAVFGALIDQGIREGHIRRDINRKVFLMAYRGAVQHVIQPGLLAQESFSSQEALAEIVRIFFAGVLTARGRNALASHQLDRPFAERELSA
jgi:AcrR family transcriptional regulator